MLFSTSHKKYSIHFNSVFQSTSNVIFFKIMLIYIWIGQDITSFDNTFLIQEQQVSNG